ncbi:MAG TPA: hypothetical protein VG733_18725, partial [Chthoniobacteraceae bacterium]|nr:hypothetical protein [Chthoniobacteraceae bacterium]
MSFLLAAGGFLAAETTGEEGFTKPVQFGAEGWRQKITGKESLILHTADGGKTWSDASPSELRRAMKGFDKYSDEYDVRRCASLAACDGKHAWLALGLRSNQIDLEFTADGGRHWEKIQTPIDADHALISFTDTRHGFLLGLTRRGDDGDRITGM